MRGLLPEDSVQPQKSLFSCADTAKREGPLKSTLLREEGTYPVAKLRKTKGFQISHLNVTGYSDFWTLLITVGFDGLMERGSIFYCYYLPCIKSRPT